RGLLSRFGGRGQTHARRTVRQSEQILAAHDVFDLSDALAVVIHDRVAGELVFLEGADDLAVVAGGQAEVFGDESRNHRHLCLDLIESAVRAGSKLIWGY